MLYLDYCATTPILDEVLEVITHVMKNHYGNPSSLHRLGMEAEMILKQARKDIAASLECKPKEIIFTSGGTESNNLAIKGAVHAVAGAKRGKHIITSQVEHPSVYECFAQLAEQGFRVTHIPVDRSGGFQLADVQNAIEDDTILVSLMHVNNEMGRIQPIEAIGKWLRQYPKITFHVDAIQSVGKIPVIPQQLGADLLSLSAHKFGGPKGAGVLYRRTGLELKPEIAGGGQEFGMRSGTENVALIAGMAKALEIAIKQQEQDLEKLYMLRKRLITKINEINQLKISGSENMKIMAPHLLHFCFPGMKAEIVIHALEQHGICISTRSACASGNLKASRILLAMGMNSEMAQTGLRVSFSAKHSLDEMDYFAACLQQVVQALQLPMIALAASKQNNRRR
ncbi:cysteine desulfurase [Paenibacillus psychroresistens]|uniref:Cysteine desulfurase n=1 Tax=Paenibacillus psychroresistens TaxID=1778678 RepID=A0A6B8RJK8_9BACL|nr:cysteine desulfurase family protein [Paenibacillus psychroresistens]QGQ95743.1 cysteine desulfurase [Paenibacillus psychroresistens]